MHVADLRFPGDPERSEFQIYRLRRDATIPFPDNRSLSASIEWAGASQGSERFALFAGLPIVEIEARVWHPAKCRAVRISVLRSGRSLESRVSPFRATLAISRVTIVSRVPLATGWYEVRLTGCRGPDPCTTGSFA
jgi:uncharacterized protein (DUF2461 family)